MLVLSLVLLVATLCFAAIFYDPDHEYNPLESATYAALNRVAWSAGVIGIIFVATFGSLNIVNQILGAKIWIPFSKLSYAAFLVHFLFQMRSLGVTISSIDIDMPNQVSKGTFYIEIIVN